MPETSAGGNQRAFSRGVARAMSPCPLERIAWFTTEHKQTVLVERRGARLLVDEGLGDLESRLGTRVFRLNRQYLACADAIVGFVSVGRGRLVVTLEPRTDDDVVVSQESGAAFRAWIAR